MLNSDAEHGMKDCLGYDIVRPRQKYCAWTAIKGTPGNKAMLSFVKVSLDLL